MDVDEVQIFVLLYADDTFILTECDEDMQNLLMQHINIAVILTLFQNKSFDLLQGKVVPKVVPKKLFQNKSFDLLQGKVLKSSVMFINNSQVEKVDSSSSLGVIFEYIKTFKLTIKNNVVKSNRVLFKWRAETSGLEFAIQTKLPLFDSNSLPILTYGCEVWGYELFEQIKKIFRNFL